MKQLKIGDLKKYLSGKNQTELIKEVLELCKIFPNVKEYYAANMVPDFEQEALKKYKKIIENEFFPARGFGKLRYAEMNKALSNFKKISKSTTHIADLMISCVEFGVQFTNAYGDIDERFYNKILTMYEDAAVYVVRATLEDVFQVRFRNVMNEGDGIGWGFSEGLAEIYYSYFEEQEEE